MAKEAYYFSHDYNARNDQKLVRLQMKHGVAGIGIYWCLIEMLYEEGGRIMRTECERIAFELRTDIVSIQSVLSEFGLFYFDGDYFCSESVNRRLEKRDQKSENARNSAKKRWKDANALPSHDSRNAIKERKGKEIKEKDSIVTPTHLERFFASEHDRMMVIKYTESMGIKYHEVRFRLYIESYDASFALTHENGDYNKWKQYLKYFFENKEYKKVKIPFEHQEVIVYR